MLLSLWKKSTTSGADQETNQGRGEAQKRGPMEGYTESGKKDPELGQRQGKRYKFGRGPRKSLEYGLNLEMIIFCLKTVMFLLAFVEGWVGYMKTEIA